LIGDILRTELLSKALCLIKR